jgi:hypothetical protein
MRSGLAAKFCRVFQQKREGRISWADGSKLEKAEGLLPSPMNVIFEEKRFFARPKHHI